MTATAAKPYQLYINGEWADGPMGMSSLMEGLLTRLRDSSIDSLTITNIDQDPWRVVTELSAQ